MHTCRAVLTPLLAASVLAGLAPAVWPRCAGAATMFVVNTVADEDVDNAACSIREAIVAANTNASYKGCSAVNAGVGDTIAFALGVGNHTINLGITPLPPITEAVTIDGGADRVELHGSGGAAVSGSHGLTVAHGGFGTVIRNLVINNFGDDGIFIDADEVWVFGCRIGTDASGTTAVPNQGFGIQVFGGNGVRIGGATNGSPCSGDCNLISGATNFKANVLLDLNATGALVRGNFIGPDVTGGAAITPNEVQGIVDKGNGDRIGGTFNTTPGGACTGDCNLISGNNINGGIVLDAHAVSALVQGNFVGTDVSGTMPISNGVSEGFSEGILSYADFASIGGTTAGARNVVSGNIGTGIQVRGVGTTVQGNYIGTDTTGSVALTGSGPGVTLYQSDSAMIGGIAPGAGNLLSGASNNGADGVYVLQSTNAQIIGNRIGTAADGVSPLPNLSHGVNLTDDSSDNFVGGASELAGNVIAFNGQYGVYVDGDEPQVRSNTIRSNRIYSNSAGGIALVVGANDDLAPPTIDGLGPLHGTACAQCIVEIFSDADGQGAVLEGTVFSADGTWSFDGPLSGPHVTATATDISHNTSPFSAPFSLFSPTPSASPTPPLPTATATAPPTATPSRTSTATAHPSASPTASASASPTSSAAPTASATARATSSATPPPSPTGTLPPTASATPPATATTGTTSTPSSTGVATASPTRSDTPQASPTATLSPLTTPTSPTGCVGDCDGNGSVTISELISGVGIALGTLPVSACPAFENGAGMVDIAQLVKGVANALDGCG